ncbi:hypothetical protein HPB48_001281 [Haemaphysalis longicornis]|uniref:Uncharacterized protein n=1 Tax=Haemaphysalis longicornis TaxID=44386 RepID=A0A9J6F8T7_HAELO|nr:hypothetical protein HPB48_001281 [Haemaphysalis longicornis]
MPGQTTQSLHGSAPAAGTPCCESGRPVLTDPITGQTVCSCQYDAQLLNYQRLAASGLPINMYGTAAAYAGDQGFLPLGAAAAEQSAFYSPSVSPTCAATWPLARRRVHAARARGARVCAARAAAAPPVCPVAPAAHACSRGAGLQRSHSLRATRFYVTEGHCSNVAACGRLEADPNVTLGESFPSFLLLGKGITPLFPQVHILSDIQSVPYEMG